MTRFLASLLILLPLLLTACAPNYSTYTNQELIDAMALRENQIPAIWAGIAANPVNMDRSRGPDNLDDATRLNTDHFSSSLHAHMHSRITNSADSMVPLLESPNPEIVINGINVYNDAARFNNINTPAQGRQRVIAALRKLSAHPDARVRWYALHTLAQMREITPVDIDTALLDTEPAMHQLAAFSIGPDVHTPTFLYFDGPLPEPHARQYRAIAIKHLTDEDWVSRKLAVYLLLLTTTSADRATLPPIPTINELRFGYGDPIWIYTTDDSEKLKKIQAAWAKWQTTSISAN
jgi:hypothetical protein